MAVTTAAATATANFDDVGFNDDCGDGGNDNNSNSGGGRGDGNGDD
jgi:hypothetical protein